MENVYDARLEPNEVVSIYATNDLGEAEIIRSALRGDGIRCELDSESQGGFVELVDIRLLVRAADADHARRVIERHASLRRTAPKSHR